MTIASTTSPMTTISNGSSTLSIVASRLSISFS